MIVCSYGSVVWAVVRLGVAFGVGMVLCCAPVLGWTWWWGPGWGLWWSILGDEVGGGLGLGPGLGSELGGEGNLPALQVILRRF